MGGARERKAASAHFRSLWLAAAGPGLVPWRLLSFAVRDTGPETERGREGARPGRWALGGGAPLLGLPISGSRHLVRAASPSVLGTQRRPALPLLSSGKGSYSPTAVISQMLRFNRDIKIERLVRQGWLINHGFVG